MSFLVLFTFEIIDASVPTSSDKRALFARSLTLRFLIFDFVLFKTGLFGYDLHQY